MVIIFSCYVSCIQFYASISVKISNYHSIVFMFALGGPIILGKKNKQNIYK